MCEVHRTVILIHISVGAFLGRYFWRSGMVSRIIHSAMILFGLPFFLPSALWSQDEAQGIPPANVSVAKIQTGMIAPQNEFIATVFYQEISDTAAEISGLVAVVHFEEGQRVKKGQVLVELGSEILRKRLQSTTASFEQVLSELEIARIDLARRKKLFEKKSISEQSYDENRFRVIGLEKRAASLRAQVEQFEIEFHKKSIRAPFDGVVIKKNVDRGEWVSEGETVAVIGKDDVIDMVAEVPERFIRYVKTGMLVSATANGKSFSGTVMAIVPRGDVATRTFPVKIRTPNHLALIEGMSARVTLPTGQLEKTLIVPRDAVIFASGNPVVFAVSGSKATSIPVKIVGYNGLTAGVESQALKEGMLVAVAGNERLRDGQPVIFRQPAD